MTNDYNSQQKDSSQMLQLVEQTNIFANKNIAYLKNLSNIFKGLSEKNERYLGSQRGLQQDIEEYRLSVCTKNTQKNFFKTGHGNNNDD